MSGRGRPAIPSGGAELASIQHLGSTARDVLNTLEHNSGEAARVAPHDDTVRSLSGSTARLCPLPPAARLRGAAFLEDVEGWVSEHEQPDADAVRAGIIVQMFVDTEPRSVKRLPGPRPV